MNTKFQTAVECVYKISDVQELYTLHRLVTQQIRALSKRATRKFVKGQQVKFQSTKYGRPVHGNIVKVGYKNLNVFESVTNTTWRVPAALVEIA